MPYTPQNELSRRQIELRNHFFRHNLQNWRNVVKTGKKPIKFTDNYA